MASIKILILDVDGVLTGGELPYDAGGNFLKTFHVQDGSGIRLWQKAGGTVAILSGRESPAVEARARELQIAMVMQGVHDKLPAYESILKRVGATDQEASFVGDDLLDIPPMLRCSYPIAVANAVPLVKRAARYVTRRCGGTGAVAEAIERLMRLNGTWSGAIGKWMQGSRR